MLSGFLFFVVRHLHFLQIPEDIGVKTFLVQSLSRCLETVFPSGVETLFFWLDLNLKMVLRHSLVFRHPLVQI